ncbi:MAG: ATPase P [Betaproteobacteria bacterium]|nr:ATPase P [Betaproteobacteria bacterium]
MISATIPGFGELRIEHLVLDYNGTLAVDGRLLAGVRTRLRALARELELHVLTADTFGSVRRVLRGMPCRIVVLGAQHQDRAKRDYVRRLGAARCACIGNGRNDRLMLEAVRLGIAVLQAEGAAAQALVAADIVTPSILDALDLLRRPLRLTATLRS